MIEALRQRVVEARTIYALERALRASRWTALRLALLRLFWGR